MKRAGLILIASLCTLPCAQAAAPAQALGKLFLTPEKRQALDHQREFNLREADDEMGGETLQLDGVVQRSSGRNSVWINQRIQPQPKGTSGADATSSPVETDEGRQVRLQVGESINRSTQERKNVLPPNAIRPGTRH